MPTPCSPLPLTRARPPVPATDVAPHGLPLVPPTLRRPPLRLRPAPAHRQRRRHLPRPLHLAPATAATPPSTPSTPRRVAPQPSSSPSLLVPPTWRTAPTGPHLRMPGAGNTDVCLHLRRVPGPGKPGATLRRHSLHLSTHSGAGNTD